MSLVVGLVTYVIEELHPDRHPVARPGWSFFSPAGVRTRVVRVKAEYPDQLDYRGVCVHSMTLT